MNQRSVSVLVRAGDGSVTPASVYRGDHLIENEQRFLVMDFGLEERLYTIGTLTPDRQSATARTEYRLTGRLTFQVQRIEIGADGSVLGMSIPTVRNFDPKASDGSVPDVWPGVTIDPLSDRRDDSPLPAPEPAFRIDGMPAP